MNKMIFSICTYTGLFNSIMFAQELAIPDASEYTKVGIAGTTALIAFAAAVYCFRAYQKVQEDRITDLKEQFTKVQSMYNEVYKLSKIMEESIVGRDKSTELIKEGLHILKELQKQ